MPLSLSLILPYGKSPVRTFRQQGASELLHRTAGIGQVALRIGPGMLVVRVSFQLELSDRD